VPCGPAVRRVLPRLEFARVGVSRVDGYIGRNEGMAHPALEAGSVAVITGAASGIGLAVAKRLAGRGLRVVVADVNDGKLPVARESLAALKAGGKLLLAEPKGHVSDEEFFLALEEAKKVGFVKREVPGPKKSLTLLLEKPSL